MVDPRSLEITMLRQYGPLMGGMDLVKALGYSSRGALREAKKSGRLQVRVFTPKRLRGHFALTLEVAGWLSRLAEQEEVLI